MKELIAHPIRSTILALLFTLALMIINIPYNGKAMDVDIPKNTALHNAAGSANAWDLPPMILNDLNGQQRNLYDWHGKVIILNFWASWCAPCQEEVPGLIALQKRFAQQGLQVVGVGMDETRKLENFARTLGINYPVLVADPDHGGRLMQQWGNRLGIIPFTVVIDRSGRLSYKRAGIFDDEVFEVFVKPLLENPRTI
jgi:peroxiredoxin